MALFLFGALLISIGVFLYHADDTYYLPSKDEKDTYLRRDGIPGRPCGWGVITFGIFIIIAAFGSFLSV